MDPPDDEEVTTDGRVFETLHDHGGHFSHESTMGRPARSYYRSFLSKDVRCWVQQCKR